MNFDRFSVSMNWNDGCLFVLDLDLSSSFLFFSFNNECSLICLYWTFCLCSVLSLSQLLFVYSVHYQFTGFIFGSRLSIIDSDDLFS